MSLQNPALKKLSWQLMYEGPDLGHLLGYQVFVQPFLKGQSLMDKITGFKYDYYLWYSDINETGGIHGGYYVKDDLLRATERGKKIFFDKKWLANWYNLIDKDCDKVERIMKKYRFEEHLNSISKKEIISLITTMLDLEYKLLSYVRCSQPQFTDALKHWLHQEIADKVKNKKEVEQIFVILTLPEDKSFFTNEELAWLDIVIEAGKLIKDKDIEKISEEFMIENYGEIFSLLKKHLQIYGLIPASDRTPAWDLTHFLELLKMSLQSKINGVEKKKHIIEQYNSALKIKKEPIKKHKLSPKALEIGSRIAKVGFYRFKSSFFWRWMGYYLVLVCKKYAQEYGLTFKEMSSLTKEEILGLLKGEIKIEKEELARRAEAELYLHYEGKDYIWWGQEAVKKKAEILGAEDYDKLKELHGEIGNTGIARGKAYVFYWSDNVSEKVRKMPAGSILVAPQTHPTYMPAIRLAEALVCDEGGVTGHAAIVSRELKKPCVIGLHIGTKAIKMGDELEVDANRGIVRIIKRAK